MRITSGCPARLIYGVQGGCDACKCVVPALADLKKVCPYYGAKGIVPSVANAWEPSASPKSLLADCSTLLMLSLEDIELQRDAPNLQVCARANDCVCVCVCALKTGEGRGNMVCQHGTLAYGTCANGGPEFTVQTLMARIRKQAGLDRVPDGA